MDTGTLLRTVVVCIAAVIGVACIVLRVRLAAIAEARGWRRRNPAGPPKQGYFVSAGVILIAWAIVVAVLTLLRVGR